MKVKQKLKRGARETRNLGSIGGFIMAIFGLLHSHLALNRYLLGLAQLSDTFFGAGLMVLGLIWMKISPTGDE